VNGERSEPERDHHERKEVNGGRGEEEGGTVKRGTHGSSVGPSVPSVFTVCHPSSRSFLTSIGWGVRHDVRREGAGVVGNGLGL